LAAVFGSAFGVAGLASVMMASKGGSISPGRKETVMPYTDFGKLNGDADMRILVCMECHALVPKVRDQEHERWHEQLKETLSTS